MISDFTKISPNMIFNALVSPFIFRFSTGWVKKFGFLSVFQSLFLSNHFFSFFFGLSSLFLRIWMLVRQGVIFAKFVGFSLYFSRCFICDKDEYRVASKHDFFWWICTNFLQGPIEHFRLVTADIYQITILIRTKKNLQGSFFRWCQQSGNRYAIFAL